MIEFLFLDLDDTILDFHKAERIALSKTLTDFGISPTQEILDTYHRINKAHWERLERREITREQVLLGRFEVLFSFLGREADPAEIAADYERNLSVGHYFLPGAEETVKALSKKYALFLASNGTASVQHGRLTSAGLYPWFQQVFISQEIGYNKPAPEFFESCFRKIPGFRKDRALMVGDSLTSDILGGIQAGIATCYICPEGGKTRADIRPDYTIRSITELPALLEGL